MKLNFRELRIFEGGRLGDMLVAGIVALTVFVCYAMQPYSGVYPSQWESVAIASGIHPADTFAGFGRVVTVLIMRMMSLGVLHLAGMICAAAIAGFAFLVLHKCLRLLIFASTGNVLWINVCERVITAGAAVAMGLSDPMWRLAQTFSDGGLEALMILSTAWVLALYIERQQIRYAAWFVALSGMLLAETPIALLAGPIFYLAFRFTGIPGMEKMDREMRSMMMGKVAWRLSWIAITGFCIGYTLNFFLFLGLNGAEGNDIAISEIPVKYLAETVGSLRGIASPLAAIFIGGTVFLPAAMAVTRLKRTTDESLRFPYSDGVFYAVLLGYGALQVTGVLPQVLRTIGFPVYEPPSDAVAILSVVAQAFTFSAALYVFGIHFFCRRHMVVHVPGRMFTLGMPVLVAAVAMFNCRNTEMRGYLNLLGDYVDEVIREAGDAKIIFTDGAFDIPIEMKTKMNGGDLRAVSMLAGASKRSKYIRSARALDSEERITFAIDGANGLRARVSGGMYRLKPVAVQTGFDLWNHEAENRIEAVNSGLLARFDPAASADVDRGRLAAKALAERLGKVTHHHLRRHCRDSKIAVLMDYARWRIAEFMRIYADELQRKGEITDSELERLTADAMDDANASIGMIRGLSERERAARNTVLTLTPREGLKITLMRGDFLLARRYAMPILSADPDEPDANFAMGMSYYVEKNYLKAKDYLVHCLKVNPKEAAVWNNLAVVLKHLGHYDKARKCVERARELAPDSEAVKSTIAEIERAAIR